MMMSSDGMGGVTGSVGIEGMSSPGVAGVGTGAGGAGTSCCHQHNAAQLPLNVRDPRLIEYLSELHLDRMSIEKFLQEEYTYDDVMHYVTREDIKNLKLKGGVELRVWKAIAKHRKTLGIDPESPPSSASSGSSPTALSHQPQPHKSTLDHHVSSTDL